jgi:Mor family transcriptional regulator
MEDNHFEEYNELEILKNIVGDEAFKKLQIELGGNNVYIPKLNQDKLRRIHEDFDAGVDLRGIARKYDYTLSWIRILMKRYLRQKYPAKKSEQRSLF